MCRTILLAMFVFSCASLAVVYGNSLATQAGGWEQYHDARLGFILEHPAGWTVQAQDSTILVQSADHSSLVLVEAFPVKPGETARSRVSSISNSHPTLFPAARFDRIAQQPSQADQVVGALSYRNARGQTEQARLLCLVYRGSGMLYALSSPSNSFANDRATLLRILMSIRFGVVPNSPTPNGARGPAKGASTAANKGLRFVRWNDPKEHAYSVEVPQGWTIEGGAFRVEPSDVRMMNRVISPEKDMVVQVGNENIPTTFIVPTPLMMRTYRVPEGVPFSPNHMSQLMLLHYMPALGYNRWYLDKVIKLGIDDISVIRESEMAEPSQRLTQEMSSKAGAGVQIKVTVAQTEFKGRSKKDGRPIIGILISKVTVQANRSNPEVIGWNAQPEVMICVADDRQEARQQMLAEILMHLNQSYREDPAYVARANQQLNRDTAVLAQQGAAAIQQSRETTAAIARNAEANRQSIMGSYWARTGAQNSYNEKFNDYLGDRTGVSDPNTGQTYKVGSGYSNYYLDPRSNTIIGTNSADRPPVDFTVLREY
ncbi:MAG: hypothetical protein QOH49_1402 [Acidobacteriota bacterium]|jgi:hypothetical protein|nr:hypothetical protein [Acidobacteriota bacterium]